MELNYKVRRAIIDTEPAKMAIIDEACEDVDIKNLWYIDNADGVDLDLYVKDSKWKFLRQEE